MANNISPTVMGFVYIDLTNEEPSYYKIKQGRWISNYSNNGLTVLLKEMIGCDSSTIDFRIANIEGNVNGERIVLIARDAKGKEALEAISFFYEEIYKKVYKNDGNSYRLSPHYLGLSEMLKETIGEINRNRLMGALNTIMKRDAQIIIRSF